MYRGARLGQHACKYASYQSTDHTKGPYRITPRNLYTYSTYPYFVQNISRNCTDPIRIERLTSRWSLARFGHLPNSLRCLGSSPLCDGLFLLKKMEGFSFRLLRHTHDGLLDCQEPKEGSCRLEMSITRTPRIGLEGSGAVIQSEPPCYVPLYVPRMSQPPRARE